MSETKQLTAYLAGPDVFRKDALEFFAERKKLCLQHGIQGLSPFDNEDNFGDELFSKAHSTHVFMGNHNIIGLCDIIIANLIPFRGACVDDGTAWELGCGYAKNKLLYGYTPFIKYNLPSITEISTLWLNIRNTEYPKIESFGNNTVNLMLQESIELSGGKIFSTFEECLINIKNRFK
jgi:nucleoside 2-deoxyribosyltransferase